MPVRRLAVLVLFVLAAAVPLSADTFTLPGTGGLWSNIGTWYQNGVPATRTPGALAGTIDTVNLTVPFYTVTVDLLMAEAVTLTTTCPSNTSICVVDVISGGDLWLTANSSIGADARLKLNGGEIRNGGILLLNATSNLDWTSGQIVGPGTTNVAAGANVNATGSSIILSNNQTVSVSGTFTYGPAASGMQINNGADLTVQSGGVVDIQNANGIGSDFTSSPKISVLLGGTFIKTAGNFGTNISPPLDNGGLVQTNTNTLVLTDGNHTGVFNMNGAGTGIGFSGNPTLNTGVDIQGAGTAFLGNVTLAGAVTATNLSMDSFGAIGGVGGIDVSGSFNWDGGSVSNVTVKMLTGSAMTITGVSPATLTSNAHLSNQGTIAFNSGGNALNVDNGAHITNDGTFNLTGDVSINSDNVANARIDNLATRSLSKTAGSGIAIIKPALNNAGSVGLTGGSIKLMGGGAHTGTLSTTGTGTVIEFAGGVHTFTLAATLTGMGIFALSNGTLDADTPLILNPFLTFQQVGGVLTGSANFQVDGSFQWKGGTQDNSSGGGQTVVTGTTSQFTTLAPINLSGRQLSHSGTATYNPSPGNMLSINDGGHFLNTGTLNIVGDALILTNLNASPKFTNGTGGVINKGTGIGLTEFHVPFTNLATLNLSSGSIALKGGGQELGTVNFGGAANKIIIDNSVYTTTASPSINGDGAIVLTGAGASLTLGATMTLNNLELHDGQLTGDVIINNSLLWKGGTMAGPGTTAIANTATVDHTAPTGFSGLDGRMLNNNGTFNYNPGAFGLTLANGSTINNSNIFNMTGGGAISDAGGAGTNSINNTGTLKKTAGSPGSRLDVVLNNNGGTVSSEAAGESLIINGGGTMNGGAMSAAGTALLDFFGGVFTATGGSFTGIGEVRVNGGTLKIDANLTAQNLGVASGILEVLSSRTFQIFSAFNFNGGTVKGPGTTRVFGGSIGNLAPTNLSADATLTIPAATFTYAGDNVNFLTINDTSNLNVENGANVSITGDGTIGGAATALASYAGSLKKTGGAGTTNINVPVQSASGTAPVIGATSGTLRLMGGATLATPIDTGAGAKVEFGGGSVSINAGASILGTGTIEVSGANVTINPALTIPYLFLNGGSIDGAGAITINGGTWSNGAFNGPGTLALPGGTFAVTASPGPKVLLRTFFNDGLLDLQGGLLGLAAGGTHTGDFAVAAGTNLGFGGTHATSATSQIIGMGDVVFVNGTTTHNGTYSIGGMTKIVTATVNYNNPITAHTSRVEFHDGAFQGSGPLTIGSTPGSVWNGTDLTGSGVVMFNGDIDISAANSPIVVSGRPIIVNGGRTATWQSALNTFTLEGGASITNYGTFLVTKDAAILAGPGGGTMQNLGTFSRTTSPNLLFIGTPFSNAGLVNLLTGTISFDGGYAQTQGTTQLAGGTFTSPFVANIDGGSLIGNGTIGASVSSDGIVAPGLSAGLLTINGAYTQSSSGTLNIEIGGTAPGTGYDRLAVTGLATLDGTVNVSLINGFVISGGDTFDPLTYNPHSGTFAVENLPPFPGGTFTSSYGSTAYSLVANNVADLSITKTGPAGAQGGDIIVYTIAVTNNGPGGAANVIVNDPLPAHLTFQQNSGDCTTNFPCNLGTIASGFTKTITSSYSVSGSAAGATITNTATVSSDTSDPVSTNNNATATTQGGCADVTPTNLAPAGNGPRDGALTWDAQPGVQYAVFFGPAGGNGCSTFFGSTTGIGSLAYNGLAAGTTYEWRVEAMFETCAAQSSSCVTFTTEMDCIVPVAPIASVVGEATSENTYAVEWDAVPGATRYEVDEATNETFTGATTFSVTGALEKEFNHKVTTATAFYYRVRAFTDCTPLTSPDSLTIRAVIIPVSPAQQDNPSANVPAGSDELVIQQVFIPGEPGQTLFFTATTDRPWMTVRPASGVLPPEGVTLEAIADPADLPNGTFTATVIVSISGNTLRSHATSVSIPVSVNLVTPVTPVPTKGGASEHAMIIPGVGHADGLNSKWQSDVRVTNAGFRSYRYRLTFTPAGGMSQGVKQTDITIDAGATTALDDIVRNWFGLGSLGDGATGMLEIVPIDDVENASKVTVASSRTYNVTANGTLGEFIPAVPFRKFIGRSVPGTAAQILSLQQLAQNSIFRTNVGLAEASGSPVSLLLSGFNSLGSKLFDLPVQLAGGQQLQINGLLALQGITTNDARVEVQVTGGSGKITGYAAVVDGGSGDPLVVSGAPLSQGNGSSRYVLPGIANVNTGFANWQSDIRIFNYSNIAQPATLTFFPTGAASRTAQILAKAGEVVALNNVIKTLFGADNLGGVLHLTTEQPSSFVVTGRTYNQTAKGTFGQFIPAVTPQEAVGLADARTLHILQVEDSIRHRTNIGLAEVTGQPVVVEVSIVLPDSKATPIVEVPLAANEFRQFAIVRDLGLGNVYNARVTVRVISGAGRVTAYGAVIDEDTGDPTYVPAQ